MTEEKTSVEIFCSYAHEDMEFREKLERQLAAFKKQGILSSWSDQNISAGQEWKHEVEAHLNNADIILLLVSPDFMASDYCYGREMQQALERHEAQKVRIIPVILRPVHWKHTPIGKLQALPTSGKPVVKWKNPDDAFYDIVAGILRVIGEIFPPANALLKEGNVFERGEEQQLDILGSTDPKYIYHKFDKIRTGIEYEIYLKIYLEISREHKIEFLIIKEHLFKPYSFVLKIDGLEKAKLERYPFFSFKWQFEIENYYFDFYLNRYVRSYEIRIMQGMNVLFSTEEKFF